MSDLQSPGSSKECVDLSLIKVSVYQHREGLLRSIPVCVVATGDQVLFGLLSSAAFSCTPSLRGLLIMKCASMYSEDNCGLVHWSLYSGEGSFSRLCLPFCLSGLVRNKWYLSHGLYASMSVNYSSLNTAF